MTPDNPSRPSESPRVSERQGSGEVRFSPNFSVYVLPPDVVCLYSETRKVFLHGELYCALASRIGAGERREAIVSVLSREFPAVKIDEAFKRLLDRGFVVPANLIDGMAAGYWASLGLGAESAAQNLAKIGVRILPATTAVGAANSTPRCGNSAFASSITRPS
jgi:ribosomal protein S12 methylthiotransferase accessory factor